MTKLDLQKELLEKVKPGTKPSDLKKQNKKQKDEGYESDSSNKSIPASPPLPNQQTKELQKQVNYWSNTASTHLKNLQLAQAKVSNLEEQLRRKPKSIAPRADFVPVKSESEQLSEKNKQIKIIAEENEKNIEKVKKLQAKIAEQDKTIEELKKQAKIPMKVKQELFTCYYCKNQQEISLLVLELPEGKLCQPCWTVLRKK